MTDIRKLLRPNIASLKPYSSARHEFEGHADILLDANENPYPTSLNRYPDPLQKKLKGKLGKLLGVESGHIFLGNGSDEAIDLLIRSFCEPGSDSILIMPPTYGMYRVCADINGIEVAEAPLHSNFNIDKDAVQDAIDNSNVKIIFICSPNNPTGNTIPNHDLEWFFNTPDTIVVIDEAYTDFAEQEVDLRNRTNIFNNVVTLRTMSKAWGLAGARLGMAISTTEIIDILNSVKPPYNVNSLTQEEGLKALDQIGSIKDKIAIIIRERERCAKELQGCRSVRHIHPSEANFILVEFHNAEKIFHGLRAQGIIIRDRRSAVSNCLRITIGTPEENDKLLSALNALS